MLRKKTPSSWGGFPAWWRLASFLYTLHIDRVLLRCHSYAVHLKEPSRLSGRPIGTMQSINGVRATEAEPQRVVHQGEPIVAVRIHHPKGGVVVHVFRQFDVPIATGVLKSVRLKNIWVNRDVHVDTFHSCTSLCRWQRHPYMACQNFYAIQPTQSLETTTKQFPFTRLCKYLDYTILQVLFQYYVNLSCIIFNFFILFSAFQKLRKLYASVAFFTSKRLYFNIFQVSCVTFFVDFYVIMYYNYVMLQRWLEGDDSYGQDF